MTNLGALLALIVAANFGGGSTVDLNCRINDPVSNVKGSADVILVAAEERNGPADGPDPHGPDPHDEIHDPGLPANKHRDDYKAPQDPYGTGRDPKNDSRPY